METSDSTEVLHDFSPLLRIYKDGRVERLRKLIIIPPSPTGDPKTRVRSKDVVISPDTGVSARLFLPPVDTPTRKLPLLIYFHGGAFCMESAFSSTLHNYVNSLAANAEAIAVSIDYRLAPENPIPACYDDSWAAIRWVFSHANGDGPDPWLNQHADLNRVFLAGDSAGANIAHNMVIRAGGSDDVASGVKVLGIVLIHPFFQNEEPDKLLMVICPDTPGICDPRVNPASDLARLRGLACRKVMICVAEMDQLRERGVNYYEALRKSGWAGEVEFVETEGERHVFHLFNKDSDRALAMLQRVASFIGRALN